MEANIGFLIVYHKDFLLQLHQDRKLKKTCTISVENLFFNHSHFESKLQLSCSLSFNLSF